LGQQCTFVQITVVLRVVSLLEVYRLTLVPHLPSGDQTPAHSESRRFTLIVVPLRLLSLTLPLHTVPRQQQADRVPIQVKPAAAAVASKMRLCKVDMSAAPPPPPAVGAKETSTILRRRDPYLLQERRIPRLPPRTNHRLPYLSMPRDNSIRTCLLLTSVLWTRHTTKAR
jgi:hypothetical protein